MELDTEIDAPAARPAFRAGVGTFFPLPAPAAEARNSLTIRQINVDRLVTRHTAFKSTFPHLSRKFRENRVWMRFCVRTVC